MSHFVYIVRCSDGTLYTGYTTDLLKRIARHNVGKGAKYTRGRRPVALVYRMAFSSACEALAAERKIKSLSRAKKLNLTAAQMSATIPL